MAVTTRGALGFGDFGGSSSGGRIGENREHVEKNIEKSFAVYEKKLHVDIARQELEKEKSHRSNEIEKLRDAIAGLEKKRNHREVAKALRNQIAEDGRRRKVEHEEMFQKPEGDEGITIRNPGYDAKKIKERNSKILKTLINRQISERRQSEGIRIKKNLELDNHCLDEINRSIVDELKSELKQKEVTKQHFLRTLEAQVRTKEAERQLEPSA